MDHRSKPTANRISVSRRGFVASATAAMAAVGAVSQTKTSSAASTPVTANAKDGRLNQSVCRWCFNGMSLDDLCKEAKEMGMVGIDLLSPNEFETVKKYGLVCTMVSSHPLSDGLCDPKYHDASLKKINEMIEATAKEGWRNVICFSGNARGIDRKTGLKNCAEALKKIVPVAEKAKVILNMELLNSRVDHADYMCDRSDGVSNW